MNGLIVKHNAPMQKLRVDETNVTYQLLELFGVETKVLQFTKLINFSMGIANEKQIDSAASSKYKTQ